TVTTAFELNHIYVGRPARTRFAASGPEGDKIKEDRQPDHQSMQGHGTDTRQQALMVRGITLPEQLVRSEILAAGRLFVGDLCHNFNLTRREMGDKKKLSENQKHCPGGLCETPRKLPNSDLSGKVVHPGSPISCVGTGASPGCWR